MIPVVFLLIIIFFVNLGIVINRIGPLELPPWIVVMAASAIFILLDLSAYEQMQQALVGQFDVFVFLFGMFVIVSALQISGTLDLYAKWLIVRSKSKISILLVIHFGLGLLASILINDTIAIIGPLILISYSKQISVPAKPLIISLSLAVTFGSTLFVTGNPQNFILASGGDISFVQFFLFAFIPTFLSLGTCFFYLLWYYHDTFSGKITHELVLIDEVYEFHSLRKLSLLSLIVLIVGLFLTSFTILTISVVMIIVTTILLFATNDRNKIIDEIDWTVMIFFAGLFIIIDQLVSNPDINSYLTGFIDTLNPDFIGFTIFVITIFIVSQLVSNVPVAILVLSILPNTDLDQPIFWMGAAIASTFAGAASVFGAASNIIVIETAKKQGININWFEFTKIGFPISLIALLELILLAGIWFAVI